MSFTVSKPIAEEDVEATLKLVLREVIKQNKVCTVLTKSSVADLGTSDAHVVLTFDDEKCKMAS